MQTQIFADFFTARATQVAPEAKPKQAGLVELDMATLEHVSGGAMGPAGTWAVTEGPAGTW